MERGNHIAPLGDGRWKVAVYLEAGPNPFAAWECETREEAEASLREWWGRRAATQRKWAEERKRESDRKRDEFVARVLAKRAKARAALKAGGRGSVVVGGIVYFRREFRSLDRESRSLARPRERRTTGPRLQRASARTLPSRDPPSGSQGDDPPPPDLVRLAAASARLWAHLRRREARQRLTA
jgi:hypothetical protein